MKLSDMGVIELKQRRASVLETLVEANNEPESDEAKIAIRGLEGELSDVSAEIDRREGRQRSDAEGARRQWNKLPAHETGAILRPDQSVRSFMQDSGRIKQAEFEDLRFGSLLRSMVTGPRSDLERRTLAENSDSTGGVSVPDITLAQFIDALRSAQVCIRAGAGTVMLDSDKTTIARTATDPVAEWRNENGPVAESDPTFSGVFLEPKSLAVLVKASRELVEDSLNVEAALEAAFREALAVELDRVCLRGSGTPPEPRGIVAAAANAVDMSGAMFTNYDPFIDAMTANGIDDEPVTSAIVLSPFNAGVLAKLKEATTNAPLARPAALEGIAFMATTGMTDTSAIVGNFSRLIIGIRSQLRVEILRELFAGNLQYGFLAHLRMDVAVEQAESFCVIENVATS